MLENPLIAAQERHNNRPYAHPRLYINTACECGKWEAVVRFNGQKLCELCAAEEGIEVL